jgi:hypothetical protein
MLTMRSLQSKDRIVATLAGAMLMGLAALPTWGQLANAKLQDGKLGIRKVEATAGVSRAAAAAGKGDSLARVVEALDAQLIAALTETGKFEVVAWSDLADIRQTQELNATFSGQPFAFAGCRYSVMVRLDDFQDFERVTPIESLGRAYSQRKVRVSGVAIIYDNTDGSVLQTATVQTSSDVIPEQVALNGSGERTTDGLLAALARELSKRVVLQVTDAIFPMRVVARENETITVNRGQAFGLMVGMEFEIFSPGPELIDPDTGRSLGRKELRIGRARIDRVEAETATARIIDGGAITVDPIGRGSILRLPQQPAATAQ